MIHPTAVVDARAELGQNVEIGPYCFVEDGVRIGDDSVLGPHVCVLRFTTLGARCRVHAHAVLGDVPQDRGFQGQPSRVAIGANCVIREGVTVHRGTKPDTATEIGDGCFLMANSHFAHNVRLGKDVTVANGALLGGYVSVGDAAFVSGSVLLHQFTRVGRLAMVGGASGLSKDVPPFCTTVPMQVNSVARLNVVGLRRAGMGSADRMDLRNAFRILYRSGLNVSQAVAEIRAQCISGPAAEMCDFIVASKRGICSGRSGDAEPAGEDA